jgi:hypothetical protein
LGLRFFGHTLTGFRIESAPVSTNKLMWGGDEHQDGTVSSLTPEQNNEYELSNLSSHTELNDNLSPQRATPYVNLGASPHQIRIIYPVTDRSQSC